WYKDADGDHHASATMRSCGSPGVGWTMDQLPVDDCNDNDPGNAKPTFGYNFNGTPVANINNGIADPGEAASLTVCDGGQYHTSGYFSSNSSDLYSVNVSTTSGKLIIDGNLYLDGNGLLTGPQFLGSAGTYTIALQNPNIGGTVIQTLTPFTDLNNNGALDAGDCTGEPIVFTYSATPCNQNKTAVVSIKTPSNKASHDAVSIRLVPNPVINILNIYTPEIQKNKPATLSVLSVSGVIMKTKQIRSLTGPIQLDVSSLVKGIYTIRFISGDKILYKKFVKL
ncbi:MAG: T9SS type A sorting domain-containing protein, partial [Ginsengibacter sp.]